MDDKLFNCFLYGRLHDLDIPQNSGYIDEMIAHEARYLTELFYAGKLFFCDPTKL